MGVIDTGVGSTGAHEKNSMQTKDAQYRYSGGPTPELKIHTA